MPDARVVIDRATTLAAPPERVWPWIVQLGKRRAGWYFPRWIEVAMPRERRGLRHVEPRWQRLAVGDVIPDWGGPAATFEVAVLDPPRALVHRSTRERRDGEPIRISWALVLTPSGAGTRLHLRLRISALGRRAPRLMTTVAGLIDEATVAPLSRLPSGCATATCACRTRVADRARLAIRRTGSDDPPRRESR